MLLPLINLVWVSLTCIICLTDGGVGLQVGEQAPGLVVIPAEEDGHHQGATGDGHPGQQEAVHQGRVPGGHTLGPGVGVTRPGATQSKHGDNIFNCTKMYTPRVCVKVFLGQEARVATGVKAGVLLQSTVTLLPLLCDAITAETRTVILLLS